MFSTVILYFVRSHPLHCDICCNIETRYQSSLSQIEHFCSRLQSRQTFETSINESFILCLFGIFADFNIISVISQCSLGLPVTAGKFILTPHKHEGQGGKPLLLFISCGSLLNRDENIMAKGEINHVRAIRYD